MAQPHSIERERPKATGATDAAAAATVARKVTKAAKYTLISLPGQSIGKLAMKYSHIGISEHAYIAYAMNKACYYGPRFAVMDRGSQAFVMAHETMHHALGHIEHGAVLYKRDPKGFSFKLHNIACDALINYVLENLPEIDKAQGTIRYGVRRCQELGIVNWDDICREMRQMAAKHKFELSPVFDLQPNQLTSTQVYHAMHRTVKQVADYRRSRRREIGWDELVAKVLDHVGRALIDPAVQYRTAPVSLDATDLYDSLANLSRTFREEDEPADREDASPVTEAEWNALLKPILDMAEKAKADPAHIFTQEPRRRSAALWNALAEVANAFNPPSGDEDFGDEGADDEQSIIDQLADDLNAHDDMREAIEKASQRGEGELMGEARRAEDDFRRVQAGAGSGDALHRVCKPTGTTATPWFNAMRRMVSSALITRFSIDPIRPSRRTVSAMHQATQPGIADADRPAVHFSPRVNRRAKAKKCVVVLDTSGSMFTDRQLIERCIKEMATICKRVNTVMTIIFADAAVCEIVEIGESYELIRTLQPKGGGGTDFRPAIAKAEEMKPDLIVYLTDLCGVFPERKPKTPIIWAYPPEYEGYATPFGQRLPLME